MKVRTFESHPCRERKTSTESVPARLGIEKGNAQMKRALAAALIMLVSAVAATPVANQFTHPSGLEVLIGLPRPDRLPEALATAWSDALELARANPTAIGYPKPHRGTGELVIPITTPAGDTAARAWTPRATVASVSRRTQPATHSWAQLELIKDQAIDLAKTVPNNPIYMTSPDWDNNRVHIWVTRIDDSLFFSLAARFGTRAIAIVVEPNGVVRNKSRDWDAPAFYGGAAIRTPAEQCTDAFSFRGFSGQYYMTTAAHCVPNGGDVWTGLTANYYKIGPVTSGSRENWSPTQGTVFLPGQSTHYGDLALIEVSGYTSAAWMYRGEAHTDDPWPVKEKWGREAAQGDQFCTGGVLTGEECAWTVLTTHGSDCRNWPSCTITAKNVAKGDRVQTPCLTGGDSGAPVYTVRPDGGVAAKGIVSGAGGNGGYIDPCRVAFTDIFEVSRAWPVTLHIQ